MIGDMDFYSDIPKVDVAIAMTKEIFGANQPYEVETRIEGKTVIFNPEFVTKVVDAMTTGCMSRMSADEEELFNRFIRYANGNGYRDITEGNVDMGKVLNDWLSGMVRQETMPVVNGCY